MSELGHLLEDTRLNAAVSWLFVVSLWLIELESLLDGELLWAGFVGFVALLAILPPLAYRNWTAMLPWEVLFVAIIPIFGRSIELLVMYAPFLSSAPLTYFAVATVALILAVELHLFTTVKMTHRFAVLFVVVTTMAASGVWAVLQWLSDSYLGTAFLHTNAALMQNMLFATAAGIFSGVLFDAYFRRRRDARLKELYEEVL